MRPDRLIIDEGNGITSGAATSFLDLVLYLIELYSALEAAILTANIVLIEMGRHTSCPTRCFQLGRCTAMLRLSASSNSSR